MVLLGVRNRRHYSTSLSLDITWRLFVSVRPAVILFDILVCRRAVSAAAIRTAQQEVRIFWKLRERDLCHRRGTVGTRVSRRVFNDERIAKEPCYLLWPAYSFYQRISKRLPRPLKPIYY